MYGEGGAARAIHAACCMYVPKQSNDNLMKLPERQALTQQPAKHLDGGGQDIHSINSCPYACV